MIQSYRDLKVWQKSIQLVKSVYAACDTLPKKEMYGLNSQMCRAAVSIPSNIAEGRSRNSRKEFYHFLKIASGSLAELETQVIIALELEYFTHAIADDILLQAVEIGKMLNGLLRSLELGTPSSKAETRNLTPETSEEELCN